MGKPPSDGWFPPALALLREWERTGKASRASGAPHLRGLPPGEGGRGARQQQNPDPRVGGPVCTSRREAARKMGVALGAQHFAVAGGTGGSPLSSFPLHPVRAKRWLVLQGAFGLCGCRSDSKKKTQPLGNDRARACVRPRSAAQQAPRAGMVITGQVQVSSPNSMIPSRTLVFLTLINRSLFH